MKHKNCDCELCKEYRLHNGYCQQKVETWQINLLTILIFSLGIGLWAGIAISWQAGLFFSIVNTILWLIGWVIYERK